MSKIGKKTEKTVIVIPVHSPNPTVDELISFSQCFNILSKHPIYVLAPDNLNLDRYREVISQFEVIFIEALWQSDLKQYNKLKINPFFYGLFKDFDFLLTYELDAFVFRDELLLWSKMKFDYIGAPWFRGHDIPSQPLELIGVGNSGFSLRNVRSCRRILKRIAFLKGLRNFWFKSRLQGVVSYRNVVMSVNYLFQIKNYEKLLESFFYQIEMYEDRYWSDFIPALFNDFKIASIEEAIKFSFELHPGLLYEMNNSVLPFGCHAWMKDETGFWKNIIDIHSLSNLQSAE